MKRVLVTFVVLVLATAALAQGGSPSGTQGASSNQGQSVDVPANQKIIKDDAEYNAYMAALRTQTPMARAQAMETFNAQYPQSIMKIDALEQTMAAYQQVTAAFHQAGNPKEVEAASSALATAYKILEINPNHVSALTVVAIIERSRVTDLPKAAKLRAVAEKALQLLPTWQKPEGMSDADFEKSKDQMAEIFEGAAGFGALQANDYAAARAYYTKSTQLDPNNLQDIYQLGLTDLKMNPIDVKGLWYIAKAVTLDGNNVEGQKAIGDYGQSVYTKYHGGVDGWSKLLADAAKQTAIPADFTVKAAPTECEIAADAVKQNPADKLSFSDWEFVLSHRDCSADAGAAAKQVWEAIESKQKNGEAKVKMSGVKVIAATRNSIEAALTEDNQQGNTADMHIVMGKPMTKPPAPGTSIDIIGVFTAYAPNPFMFTMEKGELPAAAKPKPPVHHAGAARKRVG